MRATGGRRADNLTGTFFCVTMTLVSFPRTETEVSPDPMAALNAYSAASGAIGHSAEGVGDTRVQSNQMRNQNIRVIYLNPSIRKRTGVVRVYFYAFISKGKATLTRALPPKFSYGTSKLAVYFTTFERAEGIA